MYHSVSTFVLFWQVHHDGVSVTFISLGGQDERGGTCNVLTFKISTILVGWQHSSVWCVHVHRTTHSLAYGQLPCSSQSDCNTQDISWQVRSYIPGPPRMVPGVCTCIISSCAAAAQLHHACVFAIHLSTRSRVRMSGHTAGKGAVMC